MSDRLLPRSRHSVSFVFGVVVTLALGLAPPVWIAGMPMWFYLAPGLMLAYFAPVRLILVTGLGVFAAVYLVAAPERGASTQLGLISLALVVGVAFLRASAFTRETISLAIGLLLVGAIPAALLMYLYVFGFEFSHAAFLVSRYAVQSLLAILAAELGVIIVVMSRSPVLAGLRQAFSYRPSLVQLFETVVATGLLASLTLTLILSWQSWEAQIESDMRNRAFARLEYLHNAILGSVEDRLRLAQVNLATMAVLKTTSADTIATSIRDQLCVACAVAAGVRGVDVAVSSGSAFGVTDGWSRNDAQRALEQLTEALQFNDDVAAFQWQSGSGAVYPVTGTRNAAGAAVMLRFTDSARAVDFEFSPFMNRQIQDDAVQLSRLSISEVMRRGAEPVLPDTAVVTRQFPDGLIWAEKDSLSVSPQQIMVTNLPASAQASFALPLGRVERYSSQLHGAGHYQARLAVWPYVADFARTVSLNTVALLAELVGLLILSRLVLSRLVAPLSELTRIFESWRQFRGGELGSGAALQAMDASPVSPLEDIHRLQLGFRALAQDVMYGERRLGTIAANYDELLRSLPLGVLAVDGSARVQFLNDALGNMTGQRQEVLQRLQAHAAQMLGSGRTVDEWQLLLDNEPPKSLLLVVNHRLDERGQESGLWVIVTDLTEQKQTSAQLIQASKLATLGEMSTGMAHELNQPLNVISLATSNLRFAIKKGKASSENTFSKLDRIDGAVHRAASIIDHMRAFGRLAGEGLTDINLGEVVAGACNLLGEQLKLANIALLNKVPEEGLSVKGNAIQLEQVLINLVSNSKDAIRETGSSGSITIDADVSAGRVRLRVTDSGGGIPEHALPHIFEPFFTTKPVGKGTGLGGSISYGIVREMQGDIWAENVTDGAQITISLPLSDGDESHRSLADELA